MILFLIHTVRKKIQLILSVTLHPNNWGGFCFNAIAQMLKKNSSQIMNMNSETLIIHNS